MSGTAGSLLLCNQHQPGHPATCGNPTSTETPHGPQEGAILGGVANGAVCHGMVLACFVEGYTEQLEALRKAFDRPQSIPEGM